MISIKEDDNKKRYIEKKVKLNSQFAKYLYRNELQILYCFDSLRFRAKQQNDTQALQQLSHIVNMIGYKTEK